MLAWLLDYIDERIRDDKRWNVSNEVKSFGRNIFDESYIARLIIYKSKEYKRDWPYHVRALLPYNGQSFFIKKRLDKNPASFVSLDLVQFTFYSYCLRMNIVRIICIWESFNFAWIKVRTEAIIVVYTVSYYLSLIHIYWYSLIQAQIREFLSS